MYICAGDPGLSLCPKRTTDIHVHVYMAVGTCIVASCANNSGYTVNGIIAMTAYSVLSLNHYVVLVGKELYLQHCK